MGDATTNGEVVEKGNELLAAVAGAIQVLPGVAAQAAAPLVQQAKEAAQIAIAQGSPYPGVPTKAAGIAATATTDNKFFKVFKGGPDGLKRTSIFENVSGLAVLRDEVFSGDEFDSRIAIGASVGGLLFSFIDKMRRRTWVEARAEDGSPTEWSMKLFGKRLSLSHLSAALRNSLSTDALSKGGLIHTDLPGILFAVSTPSRKQTFLTVKKSDGGPTPWAAYLIWQSIKQYVGVKETKSDEYPKPAISAQKRITPSAGAFHSVDGKYYPAMPNPVLVSSWGSSTLDNMKDELTALFTELGATFHNGAKGGEMSTLSYARLGSRPFTLTFPGNTVPVSGTVGVSVGNAMLSSALRPFAGYVKAIDGTKVYGTLSCTGTAWRLLLDGSDKTHAVASATPFFPTLGPTFRGGRLILSAGKNDRGVYTAEEIIQRTLDVVEWATPLFKEIVVIGLFVNTGTPAISTDRNKILQVNQAWADAFGPSYYDLQSYLLSERPWQQLGIAKTAADEAQIALGNKPPSLSQDNGHMSKACNEAFVTHELKPKLTAELGWF